jgi:hypothetical protein
LKDIATVQTGIIRKQAQQIVGNLFTAIGIAVSVVTMIAMLTSAGFRDWVKHHPYWVLIALLVAIVVLFVLLNVMRNMRSELRRLRRSEESRNTDQDHGALGALLNRIPPEGTLITWLRKDFSPSPIPRQQLDALKQVLQYFGSDPWRFANTAAGASYMELQNAAGALAGKLERWTSLEAGSAERIIPVEWEDNPKYAQAVEQIRGAAEGFIRAYDAFLQTCHQRGIDAS